MGKNKQNEDTTEGAPIAETTQIADAIGQAVEPLFGEPVFSRPDRTVKTKDGKSQMVAEVEFVLGGLLHIQTGVWCREVVDRDKGAVVTEFSVSLPRGVRPIKGDAISVEAVNGWKQSTLDAFDSWDLAQTEKQQKAVTNQARLVRVKPLTDGQPAGHGSQTVPSR